MGNLGQHVGNLSELQSLTTNKISGGFHPNPPAFPAIASALIFAFLSGTSSYAVVGEFPVGLVGKAVTPLGSCNHQLVWQYK